MITTGPSASPSYHDRPRCFPSKQKDVQLFSRLRDAFAGLDLFLRTLKHETHGFVDDLHPGRGPLRKTPRYLNISHSQRYYQT